MSFSLLHTPVSASYPYSISPSNSPALEAQLKKFSGRSLLPASPTGWQIESGFVRTLSYLEDGTIVPHGVWGAADIVGLTRSNSQHLECLTTVEVKPAAIANAQQLSEILTAHLQQTEELMTIRSIRRIEPALIKLLGWLANRFGRSIDRGQLLELRLTHQDIAELLGATRVTITRSLHQREFDGLEKGRRKAETGFEELASADGLNRIAPGHHPNLLRPGRFLHAMAANLLTAATTALSAARSSVPLANATE